MKDEGGHGGMKVEGRERQSQADLMGPKPVRVQGKGSGVGGPGVRAGVLEV